VEAILDDEYSEKQYLMRIVFILILIENDDVASAYVMGGTNVFS